MRSVFGLRLSAREQRTVTVGLTIVVVGLVLGYGVLPFWRSWQTREAAIAAQAEQIRRLRGLIAHESALREAVRRYETEPTGAQRMLSDLTPALAAATLQSQLQRMADMSKLTVTRLDVAGAPEAGEGGLPMIPATISAIGDIYGLSDMLMAILHDQQLLLISELAVRPNPALHGDLLQMTFTLRAPYSGS